MRIRIHLFEFEDQQWFPQVIREGMMDYLRHMIGWLDFYKPAAPLIRELLNKSGENRMIELCSGGGGSIMEMLKYLRELNCTPKVFLTDLYPNAKTYLALKERAPSQIGFIGEPVNALDVPLELRGMRVMFSAFHHFKPDQARKILLDAAGKKIPVAIFDAGTTGWWNIFPVLFIEPVTFFFLTPFFKPFRWNRLLFTYIIPLIPICTMWDGSISILRFYSEKELKNITDSINISSYRWKSGSFRNKVGIKVNYVLGIPF